MELRRKICRLPMARPILTLIDEWEWEILAFENGVFTAQFDAAMLALATTRGPQAVRLYWQERAPPLDRDDDDVVYLHSDRNNPHSIVHGRGQH